MAAFLHKKNGTHRVSSIMLSPLSLSTENLPSLSISVGGGCMLPHCKDGVDGNLKEMAKDIVSIGTV